MKNLLMIVGSLRNNSFHQQLANQVKEMIGGQAAVRFLEYADLPFLNQDVEFPPPESVARVRQAVQEADGIWIFSPEYNCQIPGVLKNLLDWLSRPLIPKDRQRISAVTGKPVTISSVAGSSAGVHVRNHLHSLLELMSMQVIGGTGTGIALDGEAFGRDTLLLSDSSKKALRAQLEQFLEGV